jgi:hypothetical protein
MSEDVPDLIFLRGGQVVTSRVAARHSGRIDARTQPTKVRLPLTWEGVELGRALIRAAETRGDARRAACSRTANTSDGAASPTGRAPSFTPGQPMNSVSNKTLGNKRAAWAIRP